MSSRRAHGDAERKQQRIADPSQTAMNERNNEITPHQNKTKQRSATAEPRGARNLTDSVPAHAAWYVFKAGRTCDLYLHNWSSDMSAVLAETRPLFSGTGTFKPLAAIDSRRLTQWLPRGQGIFKTTDVVLLNAS